VLRNLQFGKNLGSLFVVSLNTRISILIIWYKTKSFELNIVEHMSILTDISSQHIVIGNAEVMNSALINFRQFINRQSTTVLLREVDELIRQQPNMFEFSDGVLKMFNSSIKWQTFIHGGFSSESIQQAIKFSKLPQYQVFSRLISYNTPIYLTRQPLFDVFNSNDLLVSRELYDIELKLFNIYSMPKQGPKLVKSFDEFIDNMNNLFYLHWYVY